MKFDELSTEPCARPTPCGSDGTGGNGGNTNPDCANPNYRATHLSECGDDDRCSNPEFAAANPTLCLNAPRLILKPSSAVVEVLAEVQYKAFLWINGAETELTAGVLYSVSNTGIALIGASSGNAIGVTPGDVTVGASYGGYSASATLKVVASGACADQSNHFLLLFDVSKSSTGVFGSPYATRLVAAEAFGVSFIEHLNLTKDNAAVMKFDSAPAAVLAFTDDDAALIAAVQGLSPTQNLTDMAEALLGAQDYFEEQGVTGNRIIVLFTDGENNEGVDPLAIAESLRDAGIILLIVGLRAKGNSFKLIEHMASGGFFVNALPANASSVPDWLNGAKSYLCSGNCTPEGDVTVGVGQLNFNNLTNWDVIAGHIDLIGKMPGGIPVYDLAPGNGLYLDGCGSAPVGDAPDLGKIRTKERFVWESGKTYSLTLQAAGNQRQAGTDVTRITVTDPAGNVIETLKITTTDHASPFSDYTLEFAPTGGQLGGIGGQLIVEQVSAGYGVYGNLWGRVTLRNETDDITLFDDNFDNENLTYIPPCGQNSYGYDSYNCGDYGCLDAPIPAQVPDPSPLANLEGEAPPTLFTGVATATVCCPDDPSECETKTSVATSDISQADADLKAFNAAAELAQAALVCRRTFSIGDIISFRVRDAQSADPKAGFAAVGETTEDYWTNEFDLAVGNSQTDLRFVDGVRSGVYSVPSGTGQYGLENGLATAFDPLLRKLSQFSNLEGEPASFDWVFFTIPNGVYRVYLYAHGAEDADNASGRVSIGSYNEGSGVFTVNATTPIKSTSAAAGWELQPWDDERNVLIFDVTLNESYLTAMRIEQLAGGSGQFPFNGVQIKRLA